MTGFGYDPHDAEWETGDGFRTVYSPALDDDFCEVCGEKYRDDDGCGCCEGHEPGPYQPAGIEVYCGGTCRKGAK